MAKGNKIPISIKPAYFIILALALLTLPLQWIFSWIIASAFHELCHYWALRLCSCRVLRVQIDLNGTTMETDLLSSSKEILCALAGPLGGFLLLLIARWCPRIAVCGCFQSMYNLIPIFPLDGGRTVRGILQKFFSESKSNTIERYLETGILAIFVLLGLFAAFCKDLGLIPLVFAGILIIKNKKTKITCKQQPLRVE